MDDEVTGWGRSCRRRGGGSGGGGRQQRDDKVQVWGFNIPWRLWADGDRMDRLRAVAKEMGDGGANGAVGGRGEGGGTAFPVMSSNVTFAERTVDGNNAM